MSQNTPYAQLSPETILDAIEARGLITTGHLLALNSYENRVYMVGIDDHPGVVAKFYRPERWTQEQIREEHQFLQDLADEELPVVAPWKDAEGETLWQHQQYFMCLYPKRSGHPLELDRSEQLEQVGRLLGRIHAEGQSRPFKHRLTFSPQTFGWEARSRVLASQYLPDELSASYDSLSAHLLEAVDRIWNRVGARVQRIHGDFHPGNILLRDQQPWVVDFDDAVMGPRIQDIWMLFSGAEDQQADQLRHILKGYEAFTDFDDAERQLVDCCRTLRILYYAAWIAQRWHDPAFPQAFPWFASPRFWSDHILQLREQLALLTQN